MSTTIDTGGEVRDIDTGAPPQRYARGWHCLGLARDFADGAPHQVAAFGTELVVFAGEDGTLNVLDAFCRHMGGNLALGTVKGNTIACPFHDWRWRGDGKCAGIPYAKRVPPIARTRSWTACEMRSSEPRPDSTSEAVVDDTPEARATSARVTRRVTWVLPSPRS